MQPSLYPTLYVAPGAPCPAWCWPGAVIDCLPGAGIAAAPGGRCYGGEFAPGEWLPISPCAWLLDDGELGPQRLRRMRPDPRVLHWNSVEGPIEGHHWRVPCLIAWDADKQEWYTATDRMLGTDGWHEPIYGQAQERLAAIAAGCGLGDMPDEALTDLACQLLSVGHYGDRELFAALGWLSEILVVRIVRAAYLIEAGLA